MKVAITCQRGRIPANYIRWIKQAGFEPVVISRMRDLRRLQGAEGILFSGGGDLWPYFYSSEKIGDDFDLYRDILEYSVFQQRGDRGILGICRGMQIINVFLGGTLTDIAEPRMHSGEKFHFIQTAASSRLRRILGAQPRVNSAHHQAIARLAPSLAIAAYCRSVPEAAEGEKLLLVQFHPERMNSRQLGRYWKEQLALCRQDSKKTDILTDGSEHIL